jgi:hypothetical protein
MDQGGIIEIMEQEKARDPEWQEEMVNANIDAFEIYNVKSAT